MCLGFGEMKPTEESTKTTQLPGYLSAAAQANVANAGNVTSQPFQSYTAPRVAPLSGDQTAAANTVRTTAATGNPYSSTVADWIKKYSTTPGGTVSAPSILGPGVDPRTANITDYISPYVDAALRPTLEAISRQGAQARKGINAAATMSGAFGDARHGVESSNQLRDESINVGNATGQAYNTAFNTGAALRGQDLANLIGIQNTNNTNAETALNRTGAGATALENLDKYDTGRTLDLANAQNTMGTQDRTVQQAGLDSDYQEFMRKLGYSPQMLQLMSQVLSSDPNSKATTVNAVTEKPDNSGYGLLGSLAGAGLKAAPSLLALSDRRAKTEIDEVGELHDGTPVYSYRYKLGGPMHIGVMAQDVEKTNPDAVHEIGGVKLVDYRRVAARSLEAML